LRAQLIFALAQLGLVETHSSEIFWLGEYIRSFRFRKHYPEDISKSERKQARHAIAHVVAHVLTEHWSFPEDYRAFREYLANAVRRAAREYFGKPFPVQSEELEEADTFHYVPDYAVEAAKSTDERKLARTRTCSICTKEPLSKESYNVQEAARILGTSKGYVYRLCLQGRIQARSHPVRITSSGLERIRSLQEVKHARKKEIQEFLKAGKRRDAARKAVYRKYVRMPAIVI